MNQTNSFARSVKDTLCEQIPKSACCRRALLYGLLLFRQPQTEYLSEAELLLRLRGELRDEREDAPASLEEIFLCENCRRCFLRGVFIACGTVSDPAASYHLEIAIPDTESVPGMIAVMTALGLPPKATKRRGTDILYYKENEIISDFLAAIGAQNAAFEMINERIRRDFRNQANRYANCDTANINKTVSTSQMQIEAIAALRATGCLENLPDELRETARLREENPDASLAQLAALHHPPITKSGVNHRLCKIMEKTAENQLKQRFQR